MQNVMMFEKLNKELINCVNNGKTVNIHFFFNGNIIRSTIVPYEVEMSEAGIYITSDGMFQMEINKDINDIQYDDLENSYCVRDDSMELYFDF